MPPRLKRPGPRDREAALGLLKDEPIHVEPRGLLLSGDGVAFMGPEGASLSPESSSSPGGFVLSRRHGLAAAFGAPSTDLVQSLEAVVHELLDPGEALALHVSASVGGAWCQALGLEPSATLIVQGPGPSGGAGGLAQRSSESTSSGHEVEQICDGSDRRLETLSRTLREDFAAQKRWPVAFAAMAGGAIASIASAAVETERHFDVSIETERAFRGEGFGRAAAAGLIRYQRQRGKQPVWIVSDGNAASLALAASLGFVEVDRTVRLVLTA